MKKGIIFMGIGFELVGLIIGAWAVGSAVDKHFHWNGYGVATFIIAVMIGWIYHLIILLKKFMDEPDDNIGDGSGSGSKAMYDNTDSHGHERKDD